MEEEEEGEKGEVSLLYFISHPYVCVCVCVCVFVTCIPETLPHNRAYGFNVFNNQLQ